MCPDGTEFQVGDNNNNCGSLACEGGTVEQCGRIAGSWSHRKVTCGVLPKDCPPSPPLQIEDHPLCFARETLACRALEAVVAPDEAYAQCFGRAAATAAAATPMHALVAGDRVLSLGEDGALRFERVVVNQHRTGGLPTPLVTLLHRDGALRVTPDHGLWLDGRLVRADKAVAGSTLRSAAGDVTIERVTKTASGLVVNPWTSSGAILAADPSGRTVPVLASTHSAAFASAAQSVPLSLFNLCSLLWPRTLQAFYEAVIEPVTDAHDGALATLVGPDTPALLKALAFALADLVVFAGFCAYAARSLLAAAAAAALVSRAARRSAKAKCR